MKIFLLLAAMILSAFSCRGAEFDLGAPGVLTMELPTGWTTDGKPITPPSGQGSGYTITFKGDPAVKAEGLLSLIFMSPGQGPTDQAAVRTAVKEVCESIMAGSTRKLDLREFSPGQGCGAYCVITDPTLVDKIPKPGEYKVMASGVLRPTGEVLGITSLFANTADGPELPALIKIIESIQVKKAK